jgi:hypothetical protein
MWFDKYDDRALYLDKRNEQHINEYPSRLKTLTVQPDIIGVNEVSAVADYAQNVLTGALNVNGMPARLMIRMVYANVIRK